MCHLHFCSHTSTLRFSFICQSVRRAQPRTKMLYSRMNCDGCSEQQKRARAWRWHNPFSTTRHRSRPYLWPLKSGRFALVQERTNHDARCPRTMPAQVGVQWADGGNPTKSGEARRSPLLLLLPLQNRSFTPGACPAQWVRRGDDVPSWFAKPCSGGEGGLIWNLHAEYS